MVDLPIDDMLADRVYVSGRKLAQYNNILIYTEGLERLRRRQLI